MKITKRMWNISGKRIEKGQAVVKGVHVTDSWFEAKWYQLKRWFHSLTCRGC